MGNAPSLHTGNSVMHKGAMHGAKPGRSLQFGMSMNRAFSRTLTGAYDRLLPLFKNITEKFFWGFIALDITGLWPGRFVTGALAGRDKYDPCEHPEDQQLPFPQQIRRWASQNWQGLNWPNCWEEFKREVIVAPGGILMIPTLAFLLGRKVLGRAIEIRYGTLKQLGEGFTAHLQSAFSSHKGSPSKEAFGKAVANHLTDLFADPLLEKMPLDDPALREQLKALPAIKDALSKAGRAEPTYSDFLRNRFQTWTDHLLNKDLDKKKLNEALEPLVKEIQEQLLAFNRKHRMLPYEPLAGSIEDAKKITSNPTLFSDHAWTQLSKGKPIDAMPVSGLLETLTKWGEIPQKLWQWHDSTAQKSVSSLVEASEGLLKRTIARKGLVIFSLMAISTAWLMKLTRFAQSNKTYQATRKLHAGTGNANASASPALSGNRLGMPAFGPAAGTMVPPYVPVRPAAFNMMPGQPSLNFNRPAAPFVPSSINEGRRY